MLDQVVPADVDDESDTRPHRGDIREVLVGTDAEVRTALHAQPPQCAERQEVRILVRDEVVGIEEPAALGQCGRQLRKCTVAERAWGLCRCAPREYEARRRHEQRCTQPHAATSPSEKRPPHGFRGLSNVSVPFVFICSTSSFTQYLGPNGIALGQS